MSAFAAYVQAACHCRPYECARSAANGSNHNPTPKGGTTVSNKHPILDGVRSIEVTAATVPAPLLHTHNRSSGWGGEKISTTATGATRHVQLRDCELPLRVVTETSCGPACFLPFHTRCRAGQWPGTGGSSQRSPVPVSP